MQRFCKLGLLTTFCFLLAFNSVYANSIKSRGMGDTGIASDSSSNPALYGYLTFRLADFGGIFDKDVGGYSASNTNAPGVVAPGHHTSSTLFGFVPKLVYAAPFKHPNLAWGIATDGFDFHTTYSGNLSGSTLGHSGGVYGGGQTTLLFRRTFIPISIGWKVHPTFAVGASLLPVIDVLDVRGLQTFSGASNNPSNVSNRGRETSFGVGATVGAAYKPSPMFSVGASYQPQVRMSKLTKYDGLFANHGSFNVPPLGVIGVTFTPSPNWTINGDIQKLWNSTVNAVSDNNFCTFGSICLGITDGAGFGRLNVVTYKLGVQWTQNERWSWRGGFEHATAPFPSNQTTFNITAPRPIARDIFTLGFTHALSRAFALNTSFKYGPTQSITGPGNTNPTQTIRLFQTYYEFAASLTWKIDA